MNRNFLMIFLIVAGVLLVAFGANRFFGVRDITPAANIGTGGGTPSPNSEQTTPGATGTLNEYGQQN